MVGVPDIDDGTDLAIGNVVTGGQHSAVRRITLNLDKPVGSLANNAVVSGPSGMNLVVGPVTLRLDRMEGGAAFTVHVRHVVNGDGTAKLVLTFSGGSGDTQVFGGSLADGNYRLTFVPGFRGNPAPVSFHRFFGETDDDRFVGDADLATFRKALRSRRGMDQYLSFLDADHDGDVDSSDYHHFQRRYRTRLPS